MIAFGIAITDPAIYDRYASPGLDRTAEADTEVVALPATGSIFRSYNMLLERAEAMLERRDDLEGFVFIHQDAEIVSPDFMETMRAALAEPETAIVGCAGALDVRSIAWWEGAVTWASFTHRYDEYGGGELPALSWIREKVPSYSEPGEVDSVDGFVMGFTPWAIRNLRFDEQIPGALHGYDFDVCMQAKAAGKRVRTADLRVVHHHSLELISEVEGWIQTHVLLADKWEVLLTDAGEDWRARARLAEARLSAEMITAGAAESIWANRCEEQARHIGTLESSLSWRLTRPVRWVSRRVLRRY